MLSTITKSKSTKKQSPHSSMIERRGLLGACVMRPMLWKMLKLTRSSKCLRRLIMVYDTEPDWTEDE